MAEIYLIISNNIPHIHGENGGKTLEMVGP